MSEFISLLANDNNIPSTRVEVNIIKAYSSKKRCMLVLHNFWYFSMIRCYLQNDKLDVSKLCLSALIDIYQVILSNSNKNEEKYPFSFMKCKVR